MHMRAETSLWAEAAVAEAEPPPWLAASAAGATACSVSQQPWHVLHVKSRQEKILSEDLGALGIAHYLPLMQQTRHYGSRKLRVELPLFAGYLFLRGTLEQAYQADRTKRVVRIIPVADQRQLDWELRNLYLALSRRVVLDLYPFLTKGVRVEVRSGPLRGLQGVIQDRSRTDRLILQVRMLGTATSLEVDGAILDPLE